MALQRKEVEVRPGVFTTIKVEKAGDADNYVMERRAAAPTKARTTAKNKAQSTESEEEEE